MAKINYHDCSGPLYSYLGHFRKPEYIKAGHNSLPLPEPYGRPSGAPWGPYTPSSYPRPGTQYASAPSAPIGTTGEAQPSVPTAPTRVTKLDTLNPAGPVLTTSPAAASAPMPTGQTPTDRWNAWSTQINDVNKQLARKTAQVKLLQDRRGPGPHRIRSGNPLMWK